MSEDEKAGLAIFITFAVGMLLLASCACLAMKSCCEEVSKTRVGQKIEYLLSEPTKE